ncbi:MAG: hypothetical protein M3403_00030 [Gemmatimonadota bacterium]|nr:hypothetical protein [Gemmatimonadaceae bacterium]MDQ3515150.1 hypothetical protein [Gemmatimonadota bacterium]
MAKQLTERDAMICRSCEKEERASEGYPCAGCSTFICLMCTFRGVVRCKKCETQAAAPVVARTPLKVDWPEH